MMDATMMDATLATRSFSFVLHVHIDQIYYQLLFRLPSNSAAVLHIMFDFC